MSVEQRIRLCRLVEKMNSQEMYSRKLGLADISRFRGKRICRDRNRLKEDI